MPDYKKPYFQLFCIICDTLLLKKRILLLKEAQQETEELLIQE